MKKTITHQLTMSLDTEPPLSSSSTHYRQVLPPVIAKAAPVAYAAPVAKFAYAAPSHGHYYH
nr:unnamed protein product [Callosobruchus analis]